MLTLRRPPVEIEELRQRRDEPVRLLAVLHQEPDLEVPVAKNLAQDAEVKARHARLLEVAASLEAELGLEADCFAGKQSWERAIRKWERIASFFSSEPEPKQALGRLALSARREFDVSLDQVIVGVMLRYHELEKWWDEVRSSLQMRANGRANEEVLILIGELIEGKLDAQAFARDWHSHHEWAAKPAPAAALRVLAGRLRRRDMAVLVGTVRDRRQAGKLFEARQTGDRFEQAYWQRHAIHFDVSLPGLTKQVARHLRPEAGA